MATHVGTSGDAELFGLGEFDAGTGLSGRPLGETVSGSDFVYDPFDAYRAGLVSNPNVIVTGAIGSGKSSVVKMMIARALERGRRVVVVDPKGEYHSVAELLGGTSWRLGIDGWCAPFSDETGEDREAALAAWSVATGRAFSARERLVALALVSRSGPSKHPLRRWRDLGAKDLSEDLLAGLDRLIEGDLAGLFEGPGDPLCVDGSFTVVDVSAHWGRESLPLAALAAVATARRGVGEDRGTHVVIDEAWALLADPTTLTWMRGSWKLARARATSHLLVLHRTSDVEAVAPAGSAQRATADGLLRDCDTAVVMRQAESDVIDLVGTHSGRRRVLAQLGRGEALWRSGSSWSLVRLRPDETDWALIDTDQRMRFA
ncbi:MAG: type IV secretion system DNA-binding domain-containing protein [Acidimicrobiaceae bacterium]|nr:type IV secretion system DNA-binding domain-containing protein [Acidimicrobiaceae bacterium]